MLEISDNTISNIENQQRRASAKSQADDTETAAISNAYRNMYGKRPSWVAVGVGRARPDA